jgi:hypothetical protein
MALSDTEISQPASGAPAPGSRARRVNAVTAYAIAFTLYWVFLGLPTDPMVAVLWLWLATIAWNSHQPWRHHLQFARDWAPIVVLLIIYDFSRGFADELSKPHVTEMIVADKFLFGELPTLWLQERFYDPYAVHWYDALASWIYFSHFVASLAIAVVLWLRRRELWAAFMRRWFALIAAGLATYFLYPAAPPWWASQYGYISEEVVRMSNRGWQAIGLNTAGKLLDAGQAMSNPVAAMPSLHSGFAMFVVAFFFLRVRRRWIPLLAAYPLAMAVTLAYTGEHYIVDAFVGWAYVGLVFLGVGWGEKAWQARKERLAAAQAGDVVAEAEAVVVAAEAESAAVPTHVGDTGKKSAGRARQGDAAGAGPLDKQPE